MLVAVVAALTVLSWDSIEAGRIVRRPDRIDEARLLGSISSELRTGASLRMAIVAATGEGDEGSLQAVHRLALAGAPLGDIARRLADLPLTGGSIGVAIRLAEATGGRASALFERLAERAVDQKALYREARTLTVQARSSAAVVVALPVLSLLLGGGSRIAQLMAAGSGGMVVAVAGLAMQLIGSMAVWWMARA